jgi:hypothetical protein
MKWKSCSSPLGISYRQVLDITILSRSMCDNRRGLDWWMDLLTTYTSNYSATANLHNSQITTEHFKPFPACCVFTSRSLATAANSGDSSASRAHFLYSQPLLQNALWTESEAYVMTDGQQASLSWNKTTFWGLRPDVYYCLTISGLLIWGALSDERTGLSFTIAAGPRQRIIFGSESRRTRGHILPSEVRDFPFCRLLRLAGSRWRYSTPPPHGFELNWTELNWVLCYDRRSAGQSVLE